MLYLAGMIMIMMVIYLACDCWPMYPPCNDGKNDKNDNDDDDDGSDPDYRLSG